MNYTKIIEKGNKNGNKAVICTKYTRSCGIIKKLQKQKRKKMEKNFKDIIGNEEILRSLDFMGIAEPTPIQEQAIPHAINGIDVLAESKTGSGKTISFGIPVVNLIDKNIKGVQAIIIAPTRELAKQVSKELAKIAKYSRFVKIATIYGGESYDRQIQTIRSGANIVVGTPGRIKDHLKRKTLSISNVKMLVLDEADVMLDMGFAPEINDILKFIQNDNLQTMLFSATIPPQIKNIAKQYLKDDHAHVKIASKEKTADTIEQFAMLVNRSEKLQALSKIIEKEEAKKIIIFSNTKTMCEELGIKLRMDGFGASALHGDLKQNQREKVMKNFRDRDAHILIATDVAARGIDVSNVELVINYDLPKELDFYVHRIGRSGRANNKGKSISLYTNVDRRLLKNIERHINKEITQVENIIKPKDFEAVVTELREIAVKATPNEKLTAKLMYLENGFENAEEFQNAVLHMFDFYLEKNITKNVRPQNDRSNDRRGDRNDRRGDRGDRRGDRGDRGRGSFTSHDDTRIHMNIGKLDKLTTGKLLDLIRENTNIDNNQVNNIKILDKFCFFDAPKTQESKVLSSFSDFNYRGRKVSAMVAKQIKR